MIAISFELNHRFLSIIFKVYDDEDALIPKNTSVIVARIPMADKKKSGGPSAMIGQGQSRSMNRSMQMPTSGSQVRFA